MGKHKNVVQLGDVQAHIIRGAKPAAARYYFLQVFQPSRFLAFLQQPQCQSLLMSEQDIQSLRQGHTRAPEPYCFANLAFTYAGMLALGLPDALLQQFPPAFREGMAARAKFIGDEGSDAPENWQGFLGSQALHVLVALNYLPWLEPGFVVPHSWPEDSIERHDQYLRGVWQRLCIDAGSPDEDQPPGAQVLAVESAHVIREHKQIKEHFGFADGVSQPYIHDGESHRGGGGKKWRNDSPWEPLAAGEFLLGYRDELSMRNDRQVAGGGERLPLSPDPVQAAFQRLTANGSYLVYRKLDQHVKAFRAMCDTHNTQDGKLPSHLVGRDYAGVPNTPVQEKPLGNDFDFKDDPNGTHCPYASHIRRVNPRLTLSEGEHEGTLRVDQHRLIRRGMPYGPFIPMHAKPDAAPDVERGLHFFCYNARIDSQFEFVQKNWINNCDFMHFPSAVLDPIVGNRSNDKLGQFSFNGAKAPLYGLQQYVHVKGGEYFFTPGKQGLGLLLALVQEADPFWKPKQRIETFSDTDSDPFDVERYVDFGQLIAGKRFVKLWVQRAGDIRIPFYYFAYPDDMNAILNQPNVFTNVQYQQRIARLTGGEMLLSQSETPQRERQKSLTWKLLEPANFEQQMQSVLGGELASIRQQFLETGQLELVEHLARRLPLAVIRNFYGITPPEYPADGILSKAHIAHFYDRTDFDTLPDQWQRDYGKYGFKSSPDDTLLFWVRMLFLEVFGNVYNVSYISDLALNAAQEFIPLLDQQIRNRISGSVLDGTLLAGLVKMYQTEYHYSGEQLVKSVRQSVLELAVGSTDTTAKGIAQVVKTILQFGPDLQSAVLRMLMMGENKQAPALLQKWLASDDAVREQLSPMINPLLQGLALQCLHFNPVAPLLPRYCLNGATYTTSVAEVLNIEPGAVVCLVPQVTLGLELRKLLPDSGGRFLFMSDGPHACMGSQLALLEIREALKLLLALPRVRPAAGRKGQMEEKYKMPASMWLRCG